MKIWLITAKSESEPWESFSCALTEKGHDVSIKSMSAFVAQLQKTSSSDRPTLIVLDSLASTAETRQTLIDIMMVDARIHTAVVSNLPAETFHDAMEGLGTLTPLSVCNKNEALRLLNEVQALITA